MRARLLRTLLENHMFENNHKYLSLTAKIIFVTKGKFLFELPWIPLTLGFWLKSLWCLPTLVGQAERSSPPQSGSRGPWRQSQRSSRPLQVSKKINQKLKCKFEIALYAANLISKGTVCPMLCFDWQSMFFKMSIWTKVNIGSRAHNSCDFCWKALFRNHQKYLSSLDAKIIVCA